MSGEEALLAWLSARRDRGAAQRGDDAALLRLSGDYALTIDSQEAGVHFPVDTPPGVVARRTLAVNLSDLAACGAVPETALLALAAPRDYPHRRFLGAFVQACEQWGVALVGGDLSASDRLRATAVLVGRRAAGSSWLRRSTARVGDRIWVGGTLGESAAGCRLLALGEALPRGSTLTGNRRLGAAARAAIRRHLQPVPQLALGRWLAGRRRAAALDISDGFAKDLARLCDASGVGARVDLERLPFSAHLEALGAHLGTSAETLALAGGEDYVLLFTLPAAVAAPAGCSAVGSIVRERAMRARRGGRDVGPLAPAGYDHLVQR